VADLARLDATETVDVRAQKIADALLRLEGVTVSAVVAFEPNGSAEIVGSSARDALPALDQLRSRALVRYVRRRAEAGAWIQASHARPSSGEVARQLGALGTTALGFAPVHHGATVVGVLVVGTDHAWGSERLEAELTALVEVGTVATSLLGSSFDGRQRSEDSRRELERILRDRSFWPVFQPIVGLRDGAVLAFEALTRFADGTAPNVRFADAVAAGIGLEFELATLNAAISAACALPYGAALSVNVSAALVLEGTRLRAALAMLAGRELILEITEHEPVEDYALLRDAISRIGASLRWAIDDAGAGFANLRHILELRPQFVKLDRALVSDLTFDPARQALIAGLLHFSRALGTTLVAEGIETEAERLALRDLGVEAGQGYLFGRPARVGSWGTTR
jgi:EAL domain-containing protein (putative c-di-GMP-specific phosphodiesterase class I)